MNKIFKEIGFTRLIKYFIFGLWEFVFRLLPFSPLRVFWLKVGGASIDKNCVIEKIEFFNLDRTGLKGLTIGNQCYLGPLALLDLAGQITLGNQVTVSPKVTILSHHSVGFSNHPLIKLYPKQIHHTVIKSGSVLGVNSLILPGIIIGKESMVAGGAVVRQSVSSRKLVAGVPAKVKKSLHEKNS